MAKKKMDKHEVYDYIANNTEWFKNRVDKARFGEYRYLYSLDIQCNINEELLKASGNDYFNCDHMVLYGATLTAMVNDGVLERTRDAFDKAYMYRPIFPIRDDYRASSCGFTA